MCLLLRGTIYRRFLQRKMSQIVFLRVYLCSCEHRGLKSYRVNGLMIQALVFYHGDVLISRPVSGKLLILSGRMSPY